MKDPSVTVNGDTRLVDSVEEVANLSDRADPEDGRVVVHVRYTGNEWVATAEDPDLDYEARDDRKWGAMRELVELIDDRPRWFGF